MSIQGYLLMYLRYFDLFTLENGLMILGWRHKCNIAFSGQ